MVSFWLALAFDDGEGDGFGLKRITNNATISFFGAFGELQIEILTGVFGVNSGQQLSFLEEIWRSIDLDGTKRIVGIVFESPGLNQVEVQIGDEGNGKGIGK